MRISDWSSDVCSSDLLIFGYDKVSSGASGEEFGEEGGEEEAIGVRGLLDARASALRFVIGNRLVAPEPVDNARLFEARKRLNDAIFAEAGSLHDGVKAGEQRAGAIVDDAGQELDNLDAGLSDRTVTNARRGCPPLRERLPLVELDRKST